MKSQPTSELSLRLFLKWGIITEAEYLERIHPSPRYSYEDCIDWEPLEFTGDENGQQ